MSKRMKNIVLLLKRKKNSLLHDYYILREQQRKERNNSPIFEKFDTPVDKELDRCIDVCFNAVIKKNLIKIKYTFVSKRKSRCLFWYRRAIKHY